MKVRINGYEVEGTPEEIRRLTEQKNSNVYPSGVRITYPVDFSLRHREPQICERCRQTGGPCGCVLSGPNITC